MIGVIADPADEWVVREFFELFKTPWEPYRADRRYAVVLCARDEKLDDVQAKLLLLYAGDTTQYDTQQRIHIQTRRQGSEFSLFGKSFPLYCSTVTFRDNRSAILTEKESQEPAIYLNQSDEQTVARIGYDLFREVETCLVKGQPLANAGIPTLELHIEALRKIITGCGIPLVEIPPVPDGSEFIACLTHDVDHASIRRYKFDATMFGFLYRATIGSALKVARGRLSTSDLITNWAAAAKLPFIHLGLAKDFWYDFDKYLEIEGGRPSTFFVIPFEGRPGRSSNGSAPQSRGTGYRASQIAGKIQQLRTAGCEIGLHGIDAWLESESGREEAQQISKVSSTPNLGVRMHWLYGDENSPAVLEEAGFFYDSTVGYNETVGYRAGTGQVFRPMRASRLLELPMLVMDTALFYPSRLNLSQTEAWNRLTPLFDYAMSFGGTVTVNWHERSIAPERLWGDFYVRLIDELTMRGAWFSTAAQAVSWFQKRRSVAFEKTATNNRVRVKVPDTADNVPGLRLRVHHPNNLKKSHTDTSFNTCTETLLS